MEAVIQMPMDKDVFIVKWIYLLSVRILAFILSLLLTIIRVFIDVVAKMASFAASPILFLVVGWLVISS